MGDAPHHDRDIYLIFQMAKVASRSWLKLVSELYPEALTVHFHSIAEPSIASWRVVTQSKGEAQTIKHLTLTRLGVPPSSIQGFIQDNRWVGPRARIIAGVRDPVARAVSLVGFLSDRLGYTRLNVTVRDRGNAENLKQLFFCALAVAQGKDAGEDTLLRLLGFAVEDYRHWFNIELKPAFNLDVSPLQFDRERRCLTLAGDHDLFVYRVEDLIGPTAREALFASASQFLGRTVREFPTDDVTHAKRSRALYRDFVNSLTLEDEDLDWFYDHPVVKQFYSASEVDGFRNRWRNSSNRMVPVA